VVLDVTFTVRRPHFVSFRTVLSDTETGLMKMNLASCYSGKGVRHVPSSNLLEFFLSGVGLTSPGTAATSGLIS
jgi:hypothetical protein